MCKYKLAIGMNMHTCRACVLRGWADMRVCKEHGTVCKLWLWPGQPYRQDALAGMAW